MCLANPLFALGVGGTCERDANCKDGLYCDDNTCQARGDTKRGEKCRITAECGDKDYCGNLRDAAARGLLGGGEKCMDTGNCKHGLVCEPPDLSKLGEHQLVEARRRAAASAQKGGDKEQGEACASVVGLPSPACSCYEIEARHRR